jgi:hypothetical protein
LRESAGGLIRFAIAAGNAYFEAMPSKPLDLPMKVAKSFMKDLRAFHAEKNAVMEIVTACINCWQPSAAFAINSVVALTILGIAVWRTA